MALTEHRYRHDGLELAGQLARPVGEPRAAILIAHEIDGLADNVRERAEQLAAMGYIAFAADLYGGGKVYEGDASAAKMNALLEAPITLRARIACALERLTKVSGLPRDRIAAIGYCFGGGVVLELARSGANLAGVVSFHGILKTRLPPQRGTVSARILVCHGARDPLVPWADVDAFQAEMEAADSDWQLIAYGRALHAFTNSRAANHPNPALGHDPSADRQSWSAMQAFFGELFE